MSKFNPTTATPDDIAEFVKSLSDEELRNSLVHSFLQMRKINAEYVKIINDYKMAFDAIELAIEKGEIISVKNQA